MMLADERRLRQANKPRFPLEVLRTTGVPTVREVSTGRKGVPPARSLNHDKKFFYS